MIKFEEVQEVINLQDDYKEDKIEEIDNSISADNISSYTSLIQWNISKALQKNPQLDLREALQHAKDKLVNNIVDKKSADCRSEEHYLTCAVLAWQNYMNQDNIEDLYEFIVQKLKRSHQVPTGDTDLDNSKISLFTSNCSFVGPVLKLPLKPTVVMTLEGDKHKKCNAIKCAKDKKFRPRGSPSTPRTSSPDKHPPCCKEAGCADRLAVLGASTTALRKRATLLAKREAERMEIFEKAEGSWKDLELRYQRRMTFGEETERNLTKEIEKMINERNEYKEGCTPLAEQLREKSQVIEEERKKLIQIEKEIQEKAIQRRSYATEIAKGDSRLVDEQLKGSQIDRDFQYKEEQARRKMTVLQGELDAAQFLEFEAQRAMKADMGDLKNEAKTMADKMLHQEERNTALQTILTKMNIEKQNILSELGGYNQKCDSCLKQSMDDLNEKRMELQSLKQQVVDCSCKLPVHAAVQAKRTPSLAALCQCLPENKLEESCENCSCTSLRTSLLSNLLSDLFSGLKMELSTTVNMPCEILKCLEDNHNWNKATPIKVKLCDFFSNLLLKELDIAIATAIEHYHAKWVGATCADAARMLAEAQDEVAKAQMRINEREVEERAQELAAQLADQLFREKADKLAAQRAKEILSSGPPPCECLEKKEQVYPCLLQPKPLQNRRNLSYTKNKDFTSFWFKTHENVSHIRTEIESLKKATIKKEDLKSMEKKLTNIVQRATNTDHIELRSPKEETNFEHKLLAESKSKSGKGESKMDKCAKTSRFNQTSKIAKNDKKPILKNSKWKQTIDRNFAVNICMCDANNIKKSKKPMLRQSRSDFVYGSVQHNPVLNSSKPIQEIMSPNLSDGADKLSSLLSSEISCEETCICLNKVPSNTSIKELLNTLIKWQNDIQSQMNNSINIITKDDNEEKREGHILKQNDTIQSLIRYSTLKINDDIIDQYSSSDKKIKQILSDYQSLRSSNGYDYELNTNELKEKNGCKEDNTKKGNCFNKCDYSVKFLGVTLVDNKPGVGKLSKKYIKTDSVNPNNPEIVKHDSKNYFESDQRKVSKTNIYKRKSEDSGIRRQLENLINNAEIKSNNETENCICCDTDTKELEQNTFQLLQEHLTMKLKGYIKTQCKSNCIQTDDEQKILCNIFNKIKEITNNIEETKHNEESDPKLESSWNRALALLQEYLRAKMKKVQRYEEGESQVNSSVFHDEIQKKTLSTICDLIDNDFNRIKSLCVCSNKNKLSSNSTGMTSPEKIGCLSKSCSPFTILNDNTNHEVQTEKSVHFLKDIKTQMSNEIIKNKFPKLETHYGFVSNCTYPQQHTLKNKIKNITNSGRTSPVKRTTKKTAVKTKPIPQDLIFSNNSMDVFNAKVENHKNEMFIEKFNNNVCKQKDVSSVGAGQSVTIVEMKPMKSAAEINNENLSNVDISNEPLHCEFGDDNENLIRLVIKSPKSMLGKKSMITFTDNFNESIVNNLAKEDIAQTICSTSNPDIFNRDEINNSFNVVLNASKNAHVHTDLPETLIAEEDNCECKTVPLCYVKMLVDGIENLLVKKKCTCYFSKKMCPVHSKKNVS